MIRPTAWILSAGKPGMVTACRGLAEALECDYVIKKILFRWPKNWIPAAVLGGMPYPLLAKCLARGSDPVDGPWPDLIISLGWRCAGVAAAIRRASSGRVKVAHIQRPGLPAHWLDAIIVPRHDGLDGPNVVVTKTALHPLTPTVLATAGADFAATFAVLSRPLIGVLVGGSTNRLRYVMTRASITALADQLEVLHDTQGCGLAIVSSRRTPSFARERLAGLAERLGGYCWDGSAPNPYLAVLALADGFVVTADSVAMISEALSTGKPVFVARLPGRGSWRLSAFRKQMIAEGYVRPFRGRFEKWQYEPPLDMLAVAARVRALLWSTP